MKTSDVNAALRQHYSSTEYALMFEVSNATGAGARRHADAVVMGLWPSRGLLVEGIEVKVSRSDWRRELANPQKAEPVAQYCDKWWIVSPENIVQAHELPPLWGHMVVLETGRITIKKPAPQKELVQPLDRRFVASMLRRASDLDAAVVESAVQNRLRAKEAEFENRVLREVESRTRRFAKIDKQVMELHAAGIDIANIFDPKAFAKDVARGRKFSGAINSLEYGIKNLQSVLERLTEFQSELTAEDPA